MANDGSVINEEYQTRVSELARSFEEGDEEQASRLVDEIAKLREESLFRELGKLTREFHETLNGFRLDSRIATLAEHEIPDARDRLNYVITMTEQAADRTLNAVEQSVPLCDAMESQASALREGWERFTRREMDADEFRQLSKDLGQFLNDATDNAPKIKGNFQEVLMAQDFQDLTGQIIRRVITLVEDLEGSLVELIRISGQNLIPPGKKEIDIETTQAQAIEASGPPVPGVDTDGTVSGQDEVDDLLSSLGF